MSFFQGHYILEKEWEVCCWPS